MGNCYFIFRDKDTLDDKQTLYLSMITISGDIWIYITINQTNII